jgi:formylmethanofuran dehydrogenase subunit C
MPLTFELKSKPSLPLDVRVLSPDRLGGLSIDEILKIEIQFGNRNSPVSQWFDVTGDGNDEEVVFSGSLETVNAIGHSMKRGTLEVRGSAGRHLGASMSGGEIVVRGNAGDYLGYEMRGGTIVVHGDVADHVGGSFPGAKFGMNRGTILISGSAGKGLGYRMRRGTIVVGGDVGACAAWQMRAGTIMVLGSCEGPPGIDMKRGTIFVGCAEDVWGGFIEASNSDVAIWRMMQRWLEGVVGRYQLNLPQVDFRGQRSWAGDVLCGGRGELVEVNVLSTEC